MILVDSSVWIDYFRGAATPETNKLDSLLATEQIVMGDLVLAEVLQGFREEKHFNEVKKRLEVLDFVVLGGREVAVEAARNFRKLRAKGATVWKTIDTIIATRCILDGYELLHNDRDFDAFQQHLGLRVVACEA